jgi:hypothetical protein
MCFSKSHLKSFVKWDITKVSKRNKQKPPMFQPRKTWTFLVFAGASQNSASLVPIDLPWTLFFLLEKCHGCLYRKTFLPHATSPTLPAVLWWCMAKKRHSNFSKLWCHERWVRIQTVSLTCTSLPFLHRKCASLPCLLEIQKHCVSDDPCAFFTGRVLYINFRINL